MPFTRCNNGMNDGVLNGKSDVTLLREEIDEFRVLSRALIKLVKDQDARIANLNELIVEAFSGMTDNKSRLDEVESRIDKLEH